MPKFTARLRDRESGAVYLRDIDARSQADARVLASRESDWAVVESVLEKDAAPPAPTEHRKGDISVPPVIYVFEVPCVGPGGLGSSVARVQAPDAETARRIVEASGVRAGAPMLVQAVPDYDRIMDLAEHQRALAFDAATRVGAGAWISALTVLVVGIAVFAYGAIHSVEGSSMGRMEWAMVGFGVVIVGTALLCRCCRRWYRRHCSY